MSYYDFLELINQNTIDQIDYKWLCRFCLEKKSNGVNVSSGNTEEINDLLDNYYTITKECLSITDEYPNFVCALCECRLSDCASFIQQILKNGKHWETFLEKDKDVKDQGITEMDCSYNESCVENCSVPKIEEIKIEYCEINFEGDTLDTNNVYDAFDSSMVSHQLAREVENDLTVLAEEMQKDVTNKTNSRKRKTKFEVISQHPKTTDYERTCKLCNVPTFPSMRRFYCHQTQEHPGEKIFTCDMCGSQFNRKKRLATHMDDRHAKGGKKHQCQYCAKLFFSDRELKGHEKVHLNARNYVCSLCGKRFNQKSSLNTHLKTKAHNAEYKTVQKKRVYQYGFKKPIKKIIRCELCIPSIVFASIEEKAFHRNAEHRKFECNVCKNTFMAQESLDSHKLTHSDKPRPFVCTVCNASFNQSSHLTGHFKRKHTENKTFQCSYCDKSFFESCELSAHTKLVHEKQKRVKCDKCSRDFATEKYLKVHLLRQHSTDILRYDCKFCGKRLSNGVTLKRHLTKFHP